MINKGFPPVRRVAEEATIQFKGFKHKGGFSLAEVIIVVAVGGAILLATLNFGNSIFSFNSTAQENLSAQTDGRRVLKTIAKELRSTSPSSLGAYPISQAGTSSVTFFSNIDGDAQKEQVRYFLQNGSLKKGIINPSGSPLAYNSANETVTTLISNVVNDAASPIFEYFDSSYAGTSTPLASPVPVTSVRLIRINVKIDKDPNKSQGPVIVTTQVFLRNLKDNL